MDNLFLEAIIGNKEGLSILTIPELFDLAACESLYVSSNIFRKDLNRGYVVVFESSGNVCLGPTGDKHSNPTTDLRCYYAGDETKNIPTLFLRTLVQGVEYDIDCREILNQGHESFLGADQRLRQCFLFRPQEVEG